MGFCSAIYSVIYVLFPVVHVYGYVSLCIDVFTSHAHPWEAATVVVTDVARQCCSIISYTWTALAVPPSHVLQCSSAVMSVALLSWNTKEHSTMTSSARAASWPSSSTWSRGVSRGLHVLCTWRAVTTWLDNAAMCTWAPRGSYLLTRGY